MTQIHHGTNGRSLTRTHLIAGIGTLLAFAGVASAGLAIQASHSGLLAPGFQRPAASHLLALTVNAAGERPVEAQDLALTVNAAGERPVEAQDLALTVNAAGERPVEGQHLALTVNAAA